MYIISTVHGAGTEAAYIMVIEADAQAPFHTTIKVLSNMTRHSASSPTAVGVMLGHHTALLAWADREVTDKLVAANRP